ncbi:MAG TPA: winged helix-turn-helix domain-containing protein [Steroidobacteraceae bacterium]|jgi:DNA-binding winged helix-turn-helix (wHTH) protein/TolB-like protein/Tfp pilus assembly protein PilF
MPGASWIETGFVLANWEVRPRHGTVLRRDRSPSEPIRVEPRVMAVLTCLARHVGEVVTRDEFSAEVWGGRVVSDEALSRCISVLRQVFADDSREPRFIRTIARIGYTLVPTPAPLAPCAHEAADLSLPTASPVSTGNRRSTRLWAWAKPGRTALILIACFMAAGAALLATVGRRAPTEHPVAAAAPPMASLLVLPFDTREAGGYGRQVGVELADEIADSLSHVARLKITGATSADILGAAHTDAVEAGRRLGVDAVLNGEVEERPGGLRVAVRLTASKDAQVLWSRVYDRQATDIFAAESSISAAVMRELVHRFNGETVIGGTGPDADSQDVEAYQLYLRGAHQVRLRGEDSLRRAIELFSAAARRDPTYARAQVGLASAYELLPSYSYEDPAEMYTLAEKALDSAERLSHNRLESAGPRGYLDFERGKWIESETAFRSAIAADPNNPEVRQWYSQLLGAVGRIEAALAQARVAQEIDPLAPVVADRLGVLDLWLGRDVEAASDAALARELGLDEVAVPETKILLKFHQHDDADAADDLRSLQRSLHRSQAWIGPVIDAYRHPEKRPAAFQLLDRALASGDISARIYFGLMVLLESPTRALRGFAALPDNPGNYLEMLFSLDAAAVRRDPAFGAFLVKNGVEAYWDRFGWPSACRREGAQIVCH